MLVALAPRVRPWSRDAVHGLASRDATLCADNINDNIDALLGELSSKVGCFGSTLVCFAERLQVDRQILRVEFRKAADVEASNVLNGR